MRTAERTLVWLRADLRILDNPALHEAARASRRGVACVFLLAPAMWRDHDDAPNKIDLVLRTLAELSAALRDRNIPLLIRRADSAADAPAALLALAQELGCDSVFYNRQHEVNERRRDERVHEALQAAGVGVRAFLDQCVIEPGDLRTGEGRAYSVFSPFKRAWIKLLIRRADSAADAPAALLALAQELGCDSVFYNRQHEVNERRRDERVHEALQAAGVGVRGFLDQCVIEPGDLRTGEGRAYSVFSPFKRAWIKAVDGRDDLTPLGPPRKQPEILCPPDDVPAGVEGFAPTIDPALWPAGEAAALARLRAFTGAMIPRYKELRDYPAIDATSRLSPYQCVGSVSMRQCLRAALDANAGRFDAGDKGAVHWISELVWREFYRHFMVAFPRVCMGRAFKVETDRLNWRRDEADFAAWRGGRTGYPIVDAAMRQLAQTGWMHNRLRMIVAMFLTKDLYIDWRMGERWFMRNLVDGDLASNNGGWQWAASTGADAAPYFRIFNPVSQSRKFDPDGAFIRRFVPELAGVQGDAIHEPWTLPGLLRTQLDYPEPMVDHSQARDRVLAAFKALK